MYLLRGYFVRSTWCLTSVYLHILYIGVLLLFVYFFFFFAFWLLVDLLSTRMNIYTYIYFKILFCLLYVLS